MLVQSNEMGHLSLPKEDGLSFLKGGGEMGRLTREFDWSTTPINTPDHWPQSLRTTVSILLNSKFPMFLWWGDDLIQFYNDAYRPSLGNQGKHPCVGQKGEQCWPEIWEVIYPLIQQVRTLGEATWSEDQLIPIYRNGKLEDVYWTFGYSPIRGEGGNIEGVLVVCNETTEKVQNHQQLQIAHQQFRNMVMKAPVGMCIIGSDPMIVEMANDQYLELVGRHREELEGKFLWDALPETRSFYEPIMQNVRETGIGIYGQEHEVVLMRHGKIETRYVNFVYELLPDVEGAIKKIIVVVIDVTDQVLARLKIEDLVKARTMELAEVNEQLVKSNEELAQFAYIASHDLQEPVRKIRTLTHLLESSIGETNEKTKKYLTRINDSSVRMLALIRDVLAYSQVSRDVEIFRKTDLNEVFERVYLDFEFLIEEKKAVFKTTQLPTIEAIPLQMSQLFGNLLSNALKFTRDDVSPQINVSARLLTEGERALHQLPEGDFYLLEFYDNGIGFSEEHAEKIFQIFQRLHGKSSYEGTGIGLAICRRIAENHHGSITAEPRAGGGALFKLILPSKQRSEQ